MPSLTAWICSSCTTLINVCLPSDTRSGGPLNFTAHYDLLASEARLASLVAIAKGDVPARALAGIRTALHVGERPGSAFLGRHDV